MFILCLSINIFQVTFKDNATVQALIAWKQQVIKTKALRYAFEREYEFMEDKKWWALDENNRYYRYY